MTESIDLSAVTPISEPIACLPEAALPPSPTSSQEVAATSPTTAREVAAKTFPPLWQPGEPQFTKAIADYYGVSRKSVQQWFQKVKEACPWYLEADLKLPDGRYTPLCIERMGDYRTSGLPFEAWKTRLWEQNPDLVASYQATQSPSHPTPELSPTAITWQVSEDPIPVQTLDPLHLTVIDSTERLLEALHTLDSTLQQFVRNEQTLEEALKQAAQQKGSRLGTELAIAEIGGLVEASNSARVELAKKLGLLSIADPPHPQSA